MNERIGFMQGRLVPMVDGKIQCFPWATWHQEFQRASVNGFTLMEWTLDQDRLRENPLMTAAGRGEIANLRQQFWLRIPSLTGDCFMQAPFWKTEGAIYHRLLDDAAAVADACLELDIGLIIVPLVDNGSIENASQADVLRQGLDWVLAPRPGIQVLFESDFAHKRLATFIASFPAASYGINYDIGNSAALGYFPADELASYHMRIANVHVKDRRRGGITVPLGTGDADLAGAILGLEQRGYRGNYILQTARALDGDDAGAACRYRDMTAAWIRGEA